MTQAYFVTGTDTDVGKTLVACALLREWVAAGRCAVGYKPVAAGCEQTDQGLRNGDALQLQAAGNLALPYEAINPIAFAPPIAPHIAARECGQPICVETISRGFRQLQQSGADRVLVEGAGGWHLPLNQDSLLSDWVQQQGLPVILVVGARLGCLNHALLTAEAIRARGLPLAGWVMNRVSPEMNRYQENLETLRQCLNAPLLGEIPWLAPNQRAATAGMLDISLLR